MSTHLIHGHHHDMTQRWNPGDYSRDAAFVYESSHDLVAWLDPKPDERILDLGCGTGVHAAEIARRGARVLGVDSSEEMIAAARRDHPSLDFVVGNGEALDYTNAFEAVFSNAALHWMTKADAVAAGISRSLVRGGRFIFEMPEARNVRCVVDAFDRALEEVVTRRFDRSRWYFPTVGEHAKRLETAGLRVVTARVFPRPSFVAERDGRSGLHVWLRLFANDVLESLGDDVAEVMRRAEHHAASLAREGGHELDYVRMRMEARKD
jgi:trans-aconitate methyltransferase